MWFGSPIWEHLPRGAFEWDLQKDGPSQHDWLVKAWEGKTGGFCSKGFHSTFELDFTAGIIQSSTNGYNLIQFNTI